VDLLSDHRVILVVGVVGISELSIGTELKLEKLVTELPSMPNVVTEIKVTLSRHLLPEEGAPVRI
jgi:hypothetical protein